MNCWSSKPTVRLSTCTKNLVWIFTAQSGTLRSLYPSLTFHKGMQTRPNHCHFPLQHRCWTFICVRLKFKPDKSLLQPQCETTRRSLSVTVCYELFMVSEIPRDRGHLWPVSSWNSCKVSEIIGICLPAGAFVSFSKTEELKQQENLKTHMKSLILIFLLFLHKRVSLFLCIIPETTAAGLQYILIHSGMKK